MADSYPAGETGCGGILQAVPPGGGKNVCASGPQQGNVSYDDLTADGELGGQSGGADGACGVAELV